MQIRRTVEHPYKQDLMLEALLAEAQKVWIAGT
jgi:hypothetical protein